MNSLLLSMPGSPILYYGDEIGMGDNIYLGDRNGVRTPMQWSPDRNAGFSRADPQRLYLPPIMDPLYGYEAVNVEAQERDSGSQLNWLKRMLAIRKESRAFGRGRLSFLRPGNRKILAYLRELGDEAILCVANLSRSAQPVELDLKKYKGRVPVELLGRTAFPPIGDLPYLLTIPAHGFYWFRLSTDAQPPSWHTQMIVPDEAPILVLFDGWLSFFRDKVVPWRMGMADKLRAQLENEVLPQYIAGQRWYAAKGERLLQAPIRDHAIWQVGETSGGSLSWLLLILEVGDASYFLPLALGWEDDEQQIRALAQSTLARVRQQANVGVAGDALADEAFCRNLVRAIGEGRSLQTEHGTLRFTPTAAFRDVAGDDLAGLSLGPLHAQAALPEVLPAPAPRHQPRAGGRPLPHRGGALPELRAGGRGGGVLGRQRRAHHAGAAPVVRAQPGQRLELHPRLPGALPRDAARRRRGEPRRLPAADPGARQPHRRAAPRLRHGVGRPGLRSRAAHRGKRGGVEGEREAGGGTDAFAVEFE
jgi:maltose alpha-D-glucosyltransferase/alpha-amylase